MKFVGLILAWACERWIDLAIWQAECFCDELMVSVGAHSEAMKEFEDSTEDKCKKHHNVKMVPVEYKGTHSDTKAATMNKMLQESGIEEGGWVFLLDVDEFYQVDSVFRLKQQLMYSDYDHVRVEEKCFYIDMKHYLEGSHGRLWRYTSKQDHFRPTNNWSGPKANQYVMLRDDGMFHYTFLLNPLAKRAFWMSEYSQGQEHKVKWMDEIYIPFEIGNQEFWAKRNEDLFGLRSPWYNTDFRPNEDGTLFEYEGLHPEIIELVKYPQVEDFRRWDCD